MQWSELVGGDVVISPPYKWQVRFNGSDVSVASRIEKPVDPEIVDELLRKFPDFRRAYNEDELSLAEFDTYGPTIRTLRQFLEATHELAVRVRDLLLPNPDGSAS
jgi:transaldolase